VTVELPGWRFFAAFIAIGVAGAFGYRGDWRLAALIAACVAVPVAWRVRGELAATRVRLGGSGRHRGHGLRNVGAALRAAARVPLP
jgi:uncharacterized protein YfaA (DUF2138 family)